MVIDQDDEEEDEPYELDYDLCEDPNSDNPSAAQEPAEEARQAPTAPHKAFGLDADDDDAKQKGSGEGAEEEYSDGDEQQQQQNQQPVKALTRMTDTTKPVEEMKSADEESNGDYSEDGEQKPGEAVATTSAVNPAALQPVGEEDELMQAERKEEEKPLESSGQQPEPA